MLRNIVFLQVMRSRTNNNAHAESSAPSKLFFADRRDRPATSEAAKAKAGAKAADELR